jgi:hypothetical protein
MMILAILVVVTAVLAVAAAIYQCWEDGILWTRETTKEDKERKHE